MTRGEFFGIVSPLALAMRTELDRPTLAAYFRTLEDVPAPLLAAAVERLSKTKLEFFPKAGELRAAAEDERKKLLEAHPFEACVDCEDTPGWREIVDSTGAKWLQRCPCRQSYLLRLEALGAGRPLLAAMAGGDE